MASENCWQSGVPYPPRLFFEYSHKGAARGSQVNSLAQCHSGRDLGGQKDAVTKTLTQFSARSEVSGAIYADQGGHFHSASCDLCLQEVTLRWAAGVRERGTSACAAL